jgi:hypothetical protein
LLHEVGIKRRPVDIREIDETFFTDRFGEDDDDNVPMPEHDGIAS